MSLIIKIRTAGEQTIEQKNGKLLVVKDGRVQSLDGEVYYDPESEKALLIKDDGGYNRVLVGFQKDGF